MNTERQEWDGVLGNRGKDPGSLWPKKRSDFSAAHVSRTNPQQICVFYTHYRKQKKT